LRAVVHQLTADLLEAGHGDDLIPIFDSRIDSNRETVNHISLPSIPSAPTPNLIDRRKRLLRTLQIALSCQSHNWRQNNSFFKCSSNSSSGICRYLFPLPVIEKTSLGVDADLPAISQKRHVANEYINRYNETMLQVFRCNHDDRLLIGSADEM